MFWVAVRFECYFHIVTKNSLGFLQLHWILANASLWITLSCVVLFIDFVSSLVVFVNRRFCESALRLLTWCMHPDRLTASIQMSVWMNKFTASIQMSVWINKFTASIRMSISTNTFFSGIQGFVMIWCVMWNSTYEWQGIVKVSINRGVQFTGWMIYES